MIKEISLLILILFILGSCKKKEAEKTTKLVAIRETRLEKRPIIEISGENAQQISYYYIDDSGVQLMLRRANYNLVYEAGHLKKAKITGDFMETNIDFILNAQGLITEANFDSRKSIYYDYDREGHLVSVRRDYIWEYIYKGQNLSKVVIKNPQGIKINEISIVCDDKVNPLYQIPLSYLEEPIAIWGYFFLSKNNIISTETTHFDIDGNVVSKDKKLFEYSYDQQSRPIKQKRYYNEISNDYLLFEYTYQ